MAIWGEGRRNLEILSCVLQDIGPLGPLPNTQDSCHETFERYDEKCKLNVTFNVRYKKKRSRKHMSRAGRKEQC